jgi:hypothetical protein
MNSGTSSRRGFLKAAGMAGAAKSIGELAPTLMPNGTKARRIRLLAAHKTPRVDRSGQPLALTVPSNLDHEVVAMDR